MKKNQGFTLIEVAIVVIIGGILLATASTMLLNFTKQAQISATKRKIETIDESLSLFLQLNGRYPCVATAGSAIDTAAFGVEIADCTTAPTVPGGRGGRPVVRGDLPVRTLNLPDDVIGDSWGTRFTYYVTRDLARNTYNINEGGIFVNDGAGNPIVNNPAGSAHYAIVSHGENNSGAMPIAGGVVLACPAGNTEEDNCDNDATVVSTLIRGTANNALLYDDFISYRASSIFDVVIPQGAVMAFNLPACPTGWVEFLEGRGNAIVGADAGDPDFVFFATGGAKDVAVLEAETPFQTNAQDIDTATLPLVGAGTGTSFISPNPPATAHTNLQPYIALTLCEKT